ncbi:MAG TPA: bifunctional UDP-N-acetylglucosamine diphosphorylase/glucosamine-1-phosphate N-acetyltransferase GlmU, partial [Chloroflexota bacterium]|nr:bifunctional UDP-N-acetylglucosamine diphosphorylase/glucosamine-1-phosphate N-acetyltransferase GlmU [Chloroflexota bacterium]
MTKNELRAVILAAGQGTRMKSALPKVLHRVAGKPMVEYVMDAARSAGATQLVVVVGHGAEQVREHFAMHGEPSPQPSPRGRTGVELVEQAPQMGSGHALQQALPWIGQGDGEVLVLNGDAPLIEPHSLQVLVAEHRDAHMQVSFLAASVDDPRRLGRVVRQDGRARIIEWDDATDEQRRITEVNAGVYCFDALWLSQQLPKLTLSKKGEYYLTELVERAEKVRVVHAASLAACVGVDTRQALAEAERLMQERLRAHWMDEGVTFLDPGSVFLDADSRIGRDVILYPRTTIEGSDIGDGSIVGPGSRVQDSRLGAGCRVCESVLESAVLEDGVEVGPFSHLRPGSYVETGAKLGNYVEIKNARIGRDSQIHHFSYTGDAEVGQRVNIGAGTITCNFSSETGVKART